MFSLTRYSKMFPAAMFWLLLYGALWLLLTRGNGLGFGAGFSVAATIVALRLELQPWTFRITAIPAAAAFFVRAQLYGAWNVGKRTVQIDCHLKPAWVGYQFTCQEERLQLLLCAVVGLIPGTLAAKVEANTMYLHLLDIDMEWHSTIAEMERHLCRVLTTGGKN